MRTSLVLFTRDLRVHDQPALTAAAGEADRVVALFVLDDAILGSRYAAPNRVAFLLESLADLRESLRARGGELWIRRGDTVEEVAAVVREVGAGAVHLSRDVSAHARRRERRLAAMAEDLGCRLATHPGVMVVEPDELTTTSGGAYHVFTPYWRAWSRRVAREPLPPVDRLVAPDGPDPGALPGLGDLVAGATSPGRLRGGEADARRRLDTWFDGSVSDYGDGHDRMADEDGTSRLSPALHLGCVSPVEIAARVDRRRRGHEAFLRQLCWREFNHQLLAAHPDLWHRDLRPRGDDWVEDAAAVRAWKQGRTGYPVIDAGMRQLRDQGWMHNRARMLTASFLTKHLYVDWRVGAWHFMDWLVDGDLANNFAQWQWVAGTGTDSRPNRMLNPVTQGERHDPDGAYVRRYVPELADLDAADVHAPWRAEGTLLAAGDYPPPIVDHGEARAAFLDARQR